MQGRPDCGAIGESIAAGYLRMIGFGILERNRRIGRGEIDIVALDGDCLVFVEVKTRRSSRYGDPAGSVCGRKLHQMRRAAGRYINGGFTAVDYSEMRFDVIALTVDRIGGRMTLEHLKGVS
jgi:putative endonuclease